MFYWKLLWRTTYVSVLVTALALLLAYPYAYLVTRIRSSLARKTLIVLSIVPFTIGVIIRAYAWLIVMGKGGLLNSFVFLITGTRIKLMYTGGAVIVGLLQIMIPIAIIEMIPAFTAVGRDMELAAENCGANRFRTFLYVLLPLSRPGITSAALVTFTLTFTSYAVPKFLGGGQFDLIGNQIYQQVFRTMNWPFAGALSLVALLVASVLIYSIFHFIGHGELRM
ncbi:MAG: ABC transporter permease [Candidatus Acetothermia bacterium]